MTAQDHSVRADDLAVLGGTPVFDGPLAPFNEIGEAEKEAVLSVLDTGVLSGFIGAPGPDFDGGPQVKALEQAWCRRFDVRHAVSVNSATSGLMAAMGAAGIGPGDEVIVPPYTMSATAMAPLVYGGIPVFADIEETTFCLDPDRIAEAMTPKTRAIITVNLFGHASQLAALRAFADRHGLILVEDNAQAPLAEEDGKLAGTIGHIGVFSLNRHKHIQTGEGGMCVTDDDRLAQRLRLIRNHGENLVDHFGIDDLTNLVGYNYRLTELSAAVGLSQLSRADGIVAERERLAVRLSEGLCGLDGLTVPATRDGCRHVYYCWTARVDEDVLGVSRATFAKALQAEGLPFVEGYVAPLYRLPLFQQRVAIGGDGFPFSLSNRTYPLDACPVVERMHAKEVLMFVVCSYQLSDDTVDRMIEGVRKVHARRHELRALDTEPDRS